jgi:hypothetical protein
MELEPDDASWDAGVSDLADKASSTTYQAEDHTFQSGCQKSTQHAGYTGAGFMDFGGKDSLLEWNNVNAAVAGQHTLTFRYANGSSGTRQAAVSINGASPAGNVPFGSTGSWETWSRVSLQVTLKAGTNRIRVTANTDSGGPNLDAMELTSTGSEDARCATANEGASATLSCASGQVIASVGFASYGNFSASCPNLSKGSCHAASSQSKVEAQCLNKSSCVVAANNASFGDPCAGVPKRLGVTYTCKSGGTPPPPPPPSGDPKCAEAKEGGAATLSCPSAQVIRSIAFASYGTPKGACPSFSTGACHASTAKSKVEAACLNQASCRLDANNGVFGDPCEGTAKRLVVSYSCGDGGGGGGGGGGGSGTGTDPQTLQYYGSVAPSSLGPAPSHTLVDTNREFFGGTDGISHEPTAAQGAGKFIFNRIYRASKHGVGFGEQYGIYHWWLGSYGSNSIEGGIWVNPYVAGPHYYPTLHIAGVGDPYHTCTDVQFGSGMGSAFIGDRWLAMIQISNRVLTVPGANIAFDKDQPPYDDDNGMWLGWGWTYLNLAHPRGYKYWMSFVESYDYQGPINGYVPEFFNWVDPKRIQDGSYQEKRRTMSPFGTFATIGSKPDASVANEQYTRAMHVRDDIYYVPVPRMPSHKTREYVVAHPQGIESQAMEAYSNALRSNVSFDTLIKTQFKRFNGTFSSTHSQFKIHETIGGQKHLTVVRPSYRTGYDGFKGFIEWSSLSAASQNGYQYVRKLSTKWPVEPGASDEYKNHPNLYTSTPIAPPDNVQRVPRVGLKFFSYKERNTAHPDFANWNTSGKTRYTVKLQNGATATYVWFKFIDQPAFKTARQNWPQVYTETYLQRLQTYIESLHRRVRERSKVNPSEPVFINYRNPSDPSRFDPHLVRLDPGQLVVPPAGLEVGYVPVIISVVHPSEYSANGSGRNEAPDPTCTNARWTNTYHPDIP